MLRYVPTHCIEIPRQYSWIKCNYIAHIKVFKQLSTPAKPFSSALCNLFPNLEFITVDMVRSEVYTYKSPTIEFSTMNLFQWERLAKCVYSKRIPCKYISGKTSKPYFIKRYEITAFRNSSFLLSSGYEEPTGLIIYQVNITDQIPKLVTKVATLKNLRKLTFYPFQNPSLKDYKKLFKSLAKLKFLKSLKTVHFWDSQDQNYKACQYAPSKLKNFNIYVKVTEKRFRPNIS